MSERKPSFQFYPADWRSNANLNRCSDAAQGAWMAVLCLLHDSDNYGIVRWTLQEISRASGKSIKLLRELADKGVLKGSDKELAEPFIFIPRSGRKDGEPVMLINAQPGPIWFSSRMVRDEYKRQNAGKTTRFGADQSVENPSPRRAPSHRHGANQGDGSSSSSSSSTSTLPSGVREHAPAQVPAAPESGSEFPPIAISPDRPNWAPTLQEATEYFKFIRAPDRFRNFFQHYEANGWTDGRGIPIRHWQSKANQWVSRDIEQEKSKQAKETKTEKPKSHVPIADPREIAKKYS